VRKATAEFIAHYHSERNHQGLDNALICPEPGQVVAKGKVHPGNSERLPSEQATDIPLESVALRLGKFVPFQRNLEPPHKVTTGGYWTLSGFTPPALSQRAPKELEIHAQAAGAA
jgi:hypothetical protein